MTQTLAKPRPVILRWEEPAPFARGPRYGQPPTDRYNQLAAQLQDRPGTWAVVCEGDARTASNLAGCIRYGRALAFTPAGDYDATTRARGGVTITYARYLGGAGADLFRLAGDSS